MIGRGWFKFFKTDLITGHDGKGAVIHPVTKVYVPALFVHIHIHWHMAVTEHVNIMMVLAFNFAAVLQYPFLVAKKFEVLLQIFITAVL